MRFEEAYTSRQEKGLTQGEAALLPGICERSFRRQIERYEANGMDGLIDKRLSQHAHQRAPVESPPPSTSPSLFWPYTTFDYSSTDRG